MTKWIVMLALTLVPALGSATIHYSGALDDGRVATGTLASGSAWAQSDGAGVDFWSFEGNAGESISLFAESADSAEGTGTDIAFSLFNGTPDAISQPFFFSNDSDWDLFNFLALSATAGGESLLDFILPSTGMFTLAIGGEVPSFLAEGSGPFNYSLQLVRDAASVPLPGAGWLMLAGIAGLMAATRARA